MAEVEVCREAWEIRMADHKAWRGRDPKPSSSRELTKNLESFSILASILIWQWIQMTVTPLLLTQSQQRLPVSSILQGTNLSFFSVRQEQAKQRMRTCRHYYTIRLLVYARQTRSSSWRDSTRVVHDGREHVANEDSSKCSETVYDGWDLFFFDIQCCHPDQWTWHCTAV